jgi:hypothetical protein
MPPVMQPVQTRSGGKKYTGVFMIIFIHIRSYSVSLVNTDKHKDQIYSAFNNKKRTKFIFCRTL